MISAPQASQALRRHYDGARHDHSLLRVTVTIRPVLRAFR